MPPLRRPIRSPLQTQPSLAFVVKMIRDLFGLHESVTRRLDTVVEQVRQIKQGDRGIQGLPGRDGRPGKDGRDGVTVDEESIVKRVLQRIPLPRDGRDGRDPQIDEDVVYDLLDRASKKGKKISTKHVDGLEQTLSAMRTQLFSRGGYLHGGGVPSLSQGTGITLTPKSDGGFTISTSGTGGTDVWGEVPSGSGTAFALAHTPTAGTVRLYRGGARQSVTEDYTIAGANITLNIALAQGEVLVADYSYV